MSIPPPGARSFAAGGLSIGAALAWVLYLLLSVATTRAGAPGVAAPKGNPVSGDEMTHGVGFRWNAVNGEHCISKN